MNEEDFPRVAVLLPTYNGERFLSELIESVLGQSYENIELYIRDDGSSDGTKEILKKYEGRSGIHIEYGENIGVVKSFFLLLAKTIASSDYFSYCDQDDVWHPDKIKRGIQKLRVIGNKRPAIYFCRLEVVDEKLNHLAYYIMPTKPMTLRTAIVGNSVTGMATVLNKAAAELITSRIPEFTVMHDWWTYIVISAFGTIIYDERPAVKYRQYDANVVGYKVKFVDFVLLRLKKLRTGVYYKKISRQATEFYRLYGGDLSDEDREFIEGLIKNRTGLFDRIGYALKCPAYRQSFCDSIILKLMIVTNQL